MGVILPNSIPRREELGSAILEVRARRRKWQRKREQEQERKAQGFDNIIKAITKTDDSIASLEAQSSAPIPPPPLNAEFLLHLLLRHDEHDAIIGDMIERYGKKCARLGTRRANFWFYAEVLWTALPLIKRVLLKVSGMMTLAEFVRRHIS